MKNYIKICGITSKEDAQMVMKYSPDYLGFICYERSLRNIEKDEMKILSEFIRNKNSEVKLVGVFVNTSIFYLSEFSEYIDVFQFHGEESPEFCRYVQKKYPEKKIWKAFRISEEKDLEQMSQYSLVDGFVIDAFSENDHGGTGITVDENILPKINKYISSDQLFFMAGGITAKNKEKIQLLSRCNGIDLSSSLESLPGKKSETKVKEFFLGE